MVGENKIIGFDPFWEKYLEGEIRPQITTILRIVKDRIVPIFEQAETEADAVADEVWHALGYSEDIDPGTIAEAAMEKGVERFSLLTDLTFGILNLFTVYLYHLYEQHLVFIYLHELIHPAESPDPNKLNAAVVHQALAARGIAVSSFKTFPKVEELKAVCNCVKHGDGRSCEVLKQMRADLFELPQYRGQATPSSRSGPITTPLAGDSLRVSEHDFEEYVQAVLSFFKELFQTNRRVREETG